MIKVGDVFNVKVRPPIPDELTGGNPKKRLWTPELVRKAKAATKEGRMAELRVIRIEGSVATVQEYDGLAPRNKPFETTVAQLEEWERGGSKY